MMKYNTIFARSFSREEQRKLGWGAFFGCLLVIASFCMVFKPYLKSPLIVPNLQLSVGMGFNLLLLKDAINPMNQRKESTTLVQQREDVISPTQQEEEAISPNQIQEEVAMHQMEEAMSPVQTKEVLSPVHPQKEESFNLILPTENGNSSIHREDSAMSPGSSPLPTENRSKSKEMEPLCHLKAPRSDYCDITGDVRIHGSSSSIFVASTSKDMAREANMSWTVQPYARKGDQTAMSDVTKYSIKLASTEDHQFPKCAINHSVPAVVFSLGGYIGNHFHDFTDTVIPLFATARQFYGEVKFLITNENFWWLRKYQGIIRALSNYEIIVIDKEEQTHCFPSVIVGLYRWHKELSIDPSRSVHTMTDFTAFLRSSYGLNKTTAIKLREGNRRRPRLLIISRRRSRTFINEAKIAKVARRMGFTVIVTEATSNVSNFAHIVNSCDVLMGVHGAGLTNIVYLPERAVFIQVVPLGMNWLADFDFGYPAADMNLRYLKYRIRGKESSLIQQYPHDHEVFRDPSVQKMGWNAYRSIYLDKQDVKLDTARFRATLSQALQLLHQ